MFTESIGDEICTLIMDGQSLNSICSKDEMPSRVTVYKWMLKSKEEGASAKLIEFVNKYTQARQVQAETLFDECVDIADEGRNDYYTKTAKNGEEYEAVDHEHIQRSKLRVDTRIIMAERLYPKKYKPQSGVDHTSGGEKISKLEITMV